MKTRFTVLFLAISLFLGLPVSAAGSVTVNVDLEVNYSAAYEGLEQLNAVRRQNGVPEVEMDASLLEMALTRAVECAIYYSHTRPDGSGFDTARPSAAAYEHCGLAENIMYSSNYMDAAEAVNVWYESDGHRTNMLNSDYVSVGIACVRDLNGNTYWVQNFSTVPAAGEDQPSSGQEREIFAVEALTEYIDLQLSASSLDLMQGSKEVVYVLNGKTPVVPNIIRSSDEGVARLSMEDGGVCVEAVGAGNATLTLGFSGFSAEVAVMVGEPIVLESISLSQPEGGFNVRTGEKLYTRVVFHPQGAAESPLIWYVSDNEVIDVQIEDNVCIITGIAPGTATLTVSCEWYPYEWTEEITVYDDTSGPIAVDIDLSTYYAELVPGGGLKLWAYVRPDTAPQNVSWESSDPSVAEVDANGRVTAIDYGYADITASDSSGEVKARCNIYVSIGFGGKPCYFTDVPEDSYFYDAAAWATCQGLETAWIGGELGADEGCTRLDIVRYLWKLKGSPEPQDIEADHFDDMPYSIGKRDDCWAVQWAVEEGVTSGTSENMFSPDDTVTRAQAVTFLHRAAGLPEVPGSAGFTDVPAGSWFDEAAVWAVAEGITNGTGNNTFTPDKECSRAEILTFLYRQFG